MSEVVDLMAEMTKRGVWVKGFNEDKSKIALSTPVKFDEDDPIMELLLTHKPEIYSLVWVRDEGGHGPRFDSI